MSRAIQRLGRNKNAYLGETVDINRILQDDLDAAREYDWQIEEIPVPDKPRLFAFRRLAAAANTGRRSRKIYISTGIHGDEPAGPLAVRELLQENRWPAGADIWLCPCLNPTGFPLNRRENADGVDLNRDYRHLKSAEVRAHVGWLERQPRFDLTLCLHEDWESHGFYVYEVNPDDEPSLSGKMIEAVSKVCPIDLSPIIEDRPARGGIIRPDLDPAKRPQWPEAFYLIMNKTRHSYTLEAPSDFPLPARVAALVAATRAVLDEI
jgi:hypothetical protein